MPDFFQTLAEDILYFWAMLKYASRQIVQYVQWIIPFLWTLFTGRTPPRQNIQARHICTTQKILQSAKRDKLAVPFCPLFFKKWTTHPQANVGTDAIFYKPEMFVPFVMESANTSERFVAKWRRRKLLCTIQKSPNTNESYTILMEYNPIRLGFQYASDTSIPYTILNQAAMLFVKRFQCLDLFMDTTVCPGFRSPLIDIFNRYYFNQEEQTKKEQDQNTAMVLGREALWNRNRRRKDKPAEPAEYTNESFHLNTFLRIRTIQEEWTHSLKAVN